MRPLDNIRRSFKKLHVPTSAEMDEKINREISRVQVENRNRKSPASQATLWRIIMKSKMTKFAAVASIIIAVALSVTVWDTSAYALEQTIKAYEGLHYVHIKDFVEGEGEPREFWVELDKQGQVKRFRVSLPAWAEKEGPLVAVWKEGKLQIRGKKNDVIVTKSADSLGLEMLNMVKGFDPRSVVEKLRQLETEGKVEITTSQPTLKSEPIVITAKYRSQSHNTGQMILFVDQTSKLITRAIINKPENGHKHSWEFSDYNVVVDERVFLLEPTPDITEAFSKNINGKLTSLDINKSTVEDVIAVLGEPWAYKFRGKVLEKDNLPEAYTMKYPGGFIVNIYQRQVMQWGCQQIPGDTVPGYICSDSIQIGSTLEDVFKKLDSPTKVVEGFGGGDNKIMYEDNTGYANMNIRERKGFCFSRYDNNGKEIKVYFDDNVFYKDIGKVRGYCLYGTVSKGKRIRFSFMDNKVIAMYEYRTEPLETTE